MFFDIRQTARACCRGHITSLWAARLLPAFLTACALLSAGGAVALCFPAKLPFSLPAGVRATGTVLGAAAAICFPVFASGARLFGAALTLRLAGADTEIPSRFLTLRQSLRATAASLLTAFYRLFWAAFAFLPAAGVGLTLVRHCINGITFELLLILAAGTAALGVTGLVFWLQTVRRYTLLHYILAEQPLLPAREAVAHSVYLLRGKLLQLTAFRITLLPWAVPLPAFRAYRGVAMALFASSEQK